MPPAALLVKARSLSPERSSSLRHVWAAWSRKMLGQAELEDRGAYVWMHSVRRALVQGNRDICLVNLMQTGEASAEDLEWCTLDRVETSSDLQYNSAAHTPNGRTVERLWKKLRRQPAGSLASILQEKRRTHQSALEKSLQKRVKPRFWLQIKRQRVTAEPTTVSKDEQLRMDAAAAVVGASWSWAPLSQGIGHDVPESTTARRRVALTKALATAFEDNLTHGAVKAWRQSEAWFQAQHVAMPEQIWPPVFVEDFLQHVDEKAGGATALATYHRLKWLVRRAMAPLGIEDEHPPFAAAQGENFALQLPALEPAMVWELLDDLNLRVKARGTPAYRAQLQWSAPSRPSGMHTSIGQTTVTQRACGSSLGLPRQQLQVDGTDDDSHGMSSWGCVWSRKQSESF